MSDDGRLGIDPTAEQRSDLLSAYVLDALDDDERAWVEERLLMDADARAEVDRLTRVTDVLAAEAPAIEPPARLWDRIAAELPDRASDPGSGATPIRTATVDTSQSAPSVPADGDELARRRSRRRPSVLVRTAVAAAAAVVVIAVGASLLSSSDDPAVSYARQLEIEADQIAGASGSRTVTLTGADTNGTVEVVIAADGRGVVTPDGLPALRDDQTYQLWALDGAAPVSLGLMGPQPAITAIRVGGTPSTLAMSVEPAAGSTAPTDDPVVAGTVA